MKLIITIDDQDCIITNDNLMYHSNELGWGMQCNCGEENLRYEVIKSACEQIRKAALKIQKYNEVEK
jgi:hypothetical protein